MLLKGRDKDVTRTGLSTILGRGSGSLIALIVAPKAYLWTEKQVDLGATIFDGY